MAKAKTTTRKEPLADQPQLAEWPPKDFDGFDFSACPIYALDQAASQLEVRNQFDARLSQLVSMTTIITGEGAEVFRGWEEHIQDDYIWAIATMMRECKELSRLL